MTVEERWAKLSPRERNAWVAESVLGQTPDWREKARGGCLCGREESCSVCSWPLPYSEDIAVAWEVVEKLSETTVVKIVGTKRDFIGKPFPPNWQVSISKLEHDRFIEANADTAPHAICLAALKTKA